MYEIAPHLYLSNFNDAQLVPRGFFIVNCSKDLPMVHAYGMRIPVNDDLSEEALDTMSRALPIVVDHIDSVIATGGNVLVHCAAGQQRSAAVVTAYLMSKGLTMQDAVARVQAKKRDAFLTGINFMKSLKDYETYLYKNGVYKD